MSATSTAGRTGLDVAVIGGGVGGLTTALALLQAGHRVTVWERAAAIRPVGAGISLWANGVKVLDRLGLAPRLAELGGRMDRMGYAAADGRPLCEFSLDPVWDRVGQRAWPVTRADLTDLLLDAVGARPAGRVHLGARCTGVETDDGSATARFADGRSVTADLVVGADGTHSGLRSWVLGHSVSRRPVGYVNVNGLVDDDARVAPTGVWRTWVGHGRRVAVMPVGGGRRYVWFDLTGADPDGAGVTPQEEVAAAFAGWAPAVLRLVEQVADTTLNRVGIYDLEALPTWRRGRVVILGDAAHTMAPDLGQGGCQAMEDGWTLARHLDDTTVPVTAALDRWADERRPHTAGMVTRARRRAEVIHGADPAATAAWYAELDGEDGTRILDGLAQSVLTGPLG